MFFFPFPFSFFSTSVETSVGRSRRLTETRIFKGSTLHLRSKTLPTRTALALHGRHPTFHGLLMPLRVKVRSSLGLAAAGWSVTNADRTIVSLNVDQTFCMGESEDKTEAAGFTDVVHR